MLTRDDTLVPAKPAPYSKARVLTAAAEPVRLTSRSELEKIRQRNSTSHLWQAEAWRVYKNIGEIRYAFNLVAGLMSRIRLHAGVVINPDEPPVEVSNGVEMTMPDGSVVGQPGGIDPRLAQQARDFVLGLNAGQGIASLIKAYALNRQVAGESYLACIDNRWSMKSTFELRVDPAGKMLLQPSLSTSALTPRTLPKGTPMFRFYNPDPMFSSDPESALQAILANAEELILLERMIRSTVRSRMNAGMLIVASEIAEAASTPGVEGNVDNPENPESNVFQTQLIETMTQPIMDDTTGAAVVPMLVTVPAGSSRDGLNLVQEGVKFLQLSRDVDEHLIVRADAVLARVTSGLDIPRHTLEGYTNARYATASIADDNLYKQVIEPYILDLVIGLTKVYLQPLLRTAMGIDGWSEEQVAKLVIWYDPSEILTRPDRGQDADAGFDRDVLNGDTWRAAHSFSAADAPSEQELMERVFLKQVLPPNLTDYVARKLYPDYFKDAPPLVTPAQAGMAPSFGLGQKPASSRSSQGTGSDTPNGTMPPTPGT